MKQLKNIVTVAFFVVSALIIYFYLQQLNSNYYLLEKENEQLRKRVEEIERLIETKADSTTVAE